MRIAIFGLAISSSWGNGHAVLWRGLITALLRDGHVVTFFERDTPYYAEHRDLASLPQGGTLVLYPDWASVVTQVDRVLREADVGIVTSYCPDGRMAADLILASPAKVRCFYDLDTPVTLARLSAGETPDYVPAAGLGDFDLVLSYTGGEALAALVTQLGARRVVPLHGWVDPECYRPAGPQPQYRATLSYLGTYAEDRQPMLESLFVEPARRLPASRFVIGGAQYPKHFPWCDNIFFVRHLPPVEHPAFYGASRMTLNVTRRAMASMGWCPSGRLFEAAACGVPILSDSWPGLDSFFVPGDEILVVNDTQDVLAAVELSDATLAAVARRGRERTLAQHTALHRAREMIAAFELATSSVALEA